MAQFLSMLLVHLLLYALISGDVSKIKRTKKLVSVGQMITLECDGDQKRNATMYTWRRLSDCSRSDVPIKGRFVDQKDKLFKFVVEQQDLGGLWICEAIYTQHIRTAEVVNLYSLVSPTATNGETTQICGQDRCVNPGDVCVAALIGMTTQVHCLSADTVPDQLFTQSGFYADPRSACLTRRGRRGCGQDAALFTDNTHCCYCFGRRCADRYRMNQAQLVWQEREDGNAVQSTTCAELAALRSDDDEDGVSQAGGGALLIILLLVGFAVLLVLIVALGLLAIYFRRRRKFGYRPERRVTLREPVEITGPVDTILY